MPSSPAPKPRNDAERRAAWWYRLRGYRILDTNRWLAGNELDVVARRGRTLVFCEVKTRRGASFGGGFESVTARKQRKLRQLGETYLRASGERPVSIRFDVASVTMSAEGRIDVQLFEDAF